MVITLPGKPEETGRMPGRRSVVRFAAATAVALYVIGGSTEPRAALCRKKSRVVFRAGECKPNETQVTGDLVGAVGPTGAPGTPGAQGPPGSPGGIVLLSADGKVVGRWIAGANQLIAVSPADGTAIVLLVADVAGFVANDADDLNILHEDEACQGAPLFQASSPVARSAQVADGVAYHAGRPVGMHLIRSSSFVSDAPCVLPSPIPGFCCMAAGVPNDAMAGPLRTFPTALLGAPPFHLGR